VLEPGVAYPVAERGGDRGELHLLGLQRPRVSFGAVRQRYRAGQGDSDAARLMSLRVLPPTARRPGSPWG
jgi:hypothetical protein